MIDPISKHVMGTVSEVLANLQVPLNACAYRSAHNLSTKEHAHMHLKSVELEGGCLGKVKDQHEQGNRKIMWK